MLLSDEDRRRFADFLLRDAESNELVASQFVKMSGMPAAVVESLTKQKKQLALAQRIVARELMSGEFQTL